MEAGQPNKNRIGCIIQARMESSRLPGKVLLPLPFSGGPPTIGWIVSSLRRSSLDLIPIVATSREPSDNPIADYCSKNEIDFFRGSHHDVLSRFTQLIDSKGLQTVVRLTGDNPFVDTQQLEDTIDYHLRNSLGYTRTEGLPLGMNFEVVDGHTLLNSETSELTDTEREHVTMHIRNSRNFKKGTREVKCGLKHLRMTIDYPTDYLVVGEAIEWLNKKGKMNIEGLSGLYSDYPWLFELNQSNYQKIIPKSLKEELQAAIDILERSEMPRAAEYLTQYFKTSPTQ